MISWNKIQRRNPITSTLAWYPTIVTQGYAGVDDIIAGIVGKCTLTAVDVKAVLTAVDVKAVLIALEEVVIEQIKLGKSVRFLNLGSFRPTIQCRAWDEEKQKWGTGGSPVPTDRFDPESGELVAKGVKTENIKGISVVFTKGAEMQRQLQRSMLKFKMVPGETKYVPKK